MPAHPPGLAARPATPAVALLTAVAAFTVAAVLDGRPQSTGGWWIVLGLSGGYAVSGSV